MGVLEPLRKVFARTPEARERGLKPTAFSFNSAAGACRVCEGAGYEKVELQFLPDAFVKCGACDGRRFRAEVLEVRVHGLSIADALDLPAADVVRLFGAHAGVREALQPMLDLGLGYLSLSQPAPTLSGGEAQRLKLARALAEAASAPGRLYLLDEPTTGLHAADVAVLVGALHRLVDAGHSVVVVEHDMELATSADWIVDLGPEAGDEGGRLVGEGTPETVAALDTPTGRALAEALGRRAEPATSASGEAMAFEPGAAPSAIRIKGAREHNLQRVDVDIPRDKLVAVTGVSGSGKSTLAFDVLFAEGQRRFLDCLSTYVRQFIRPLARPEVDRLEGVPPTVALEQKLSRGTPLSTVGTASEVYHHLRLLWSRLGAVHCPKCGLPGQVVDVAALAARVASDFPRGELALFAPLVRRRKGFHKDAILAAARKGVAEVRIDGAIYPAASPPRVDRFQIHDVEALVDRVSERTRPRGPRGGDRARPRSRRAGPCWPWARAASASTRPGAPARAAAPAFRPPTRGSSRGARSTARARSATASARRGSRRTASSRRARGGRLSRLLRERGCGPRRGPSGSRAATSARSRRSRCASCARGSGRSKASSPTRCASASGRSWCCGSTCSTASGSRYLTLERGADTLSTGEAQRIRIVAALASNLRGVCYVLDEPTVGLHPRDDEALTQALLGLRDRGNTVVVVEHEESVIRAADHVIDLGPGAGPHGGRLVATGHAAAGGPRDGVGHRPLAARRRASSRPGRGAA